MSSKDPIRGVRGMNDVLPADEGLWRRFEDTVQSTLSAYGYGRIRTPILEHTRLFVRGIGEVTDIVEKEMYSFTDALNGEELTLRPENTAGVVRAVIEHSLVHDGPKRLWYTGPMFRHERPQKGRYRQFHQVGAEVLGAGGAAVDAELIMIGQRLWDDLDLAGVKLQVNSLGHAHERAAHRAELIAYLERHVDVLDQDARRRLHTNPLRILDTKNPAMQSLVEGAPRLLDHLGSESRAQFDALCGLLHDQNLPFEVEPRLVRGLDYYNLTVFEWVADGLTICGGGRYDPLIELLGGKPSQGSGFAIGVERVLELMRARQGEERNPGCDVYVVHFGAGTTGLAFAAAERLRDAGLDVILHCGEGGPKAQFRRADASGAAFAVVVGEAEAEAGEVAVKALRDRDAVQTRVALPALAGHVTDLMAR